MNSGRALPFPPWAVPFVRQSWERDEHTIYGRFDLAYDGSGAPKLLEYNADTPTALLEAAVIQWFWFQDWQHTPEAQTTLQTLGANGWDQWNSIHERLIEAWRRLLPTIKGTLVFTGLNDNLEDFTTISYLRETAMQADIQTSFLPIAQLGWNARRRLFTGLNEQALTDVWKLYPWEWLLREQFGRHLVQAPTRWLEAPWKMLLSNKAILPVLHHLFPDSPYLLRADWQPWSDTYVAKPILSREGANLSMVRDGKVLYDTPGPYGNYSRIFQELYELPQHDGYYPVLGSWMVNGYACGLGIREDRSRVTGNLSRFIPHLFYT